MRRSSKTTNDLSILSNKNTLRIKRIPRETLRCVSPRINIKISFRSCRKRKENL